MYQNDTYEKLLVTDFKGGINVTDPSFMLPANQFNEMRDFQFSQAGILEPRPPFRPETFSASVDNNAILTSKVAITAHATQNEEWTLTFPAAAASGTFKLTLSGTAQTEVETAAITFSTTEADLAYNVETAIEASAGFTASCTVADVSGTDNTVKITFNGSGFAGKSFSVELSSEAVVDGSSNSTAGTLTRTKGPVQITTQSAHGYSNGDYITIIGSDYYDGKYAILNVAATTYEIAADYGTASGTTYPGAPTFEMKFNEAVGALPQDTSGNNNHITSAVRLYGTSIVGSGKFGNALNCPGTNPGCARISDDIIGTEDLDLGTGDLSIVFWMKSNNEFTTYPFPRIVHKYADGRGYEIYMINPGAMRLRLYDGTGTYRLTSTSTALNDNQWHHIAFTIDRNGIATMYIDAIPKTVANGGIAETGALSEVTDTIDNTGHLQIGGSGSSTNLWAGLLDELRIYKKVLTQDDVDWLQLEESSSSSAGGVCGYSPTRIINSYAFPCEVTGWNYKGTLFTVTAKFGDITDEPTRVLAFNVIDHVWSQIYETITTDAISVCPYKINSAFDLLIFPDSADALRWPVGGTTPATSTLGVTPPTNADFNVVFAQQASGDMDIAAGDNLYYKFSYFYDDKNVTTKYGESTTTAMATSASTGALLADSSASIKLTFTVAGTPKQLPVDGVSYVKIYRSRFSAGPFKYITKATVTYSTDDTIAETIDNVPYDFEGEEDELDGSNPDTANLRMIKTKTIGSSVMGFQADMPNKLIWSTPGQPDVWNPLSYDYLEGDGKCAIEFNRKIYVFTTKGCYEKESVTAPAFRICNIGTIDGGSVQNVGTGLIWMDYDTIYFADFVQQYGSKGDFPLDIGHAVSAKLIDLDHVSREPSSTKPISSSFKNQRYMVSFYTKDSTVSRTYTYDLTFGAWTEWSLWGDILMESGSNYYHVGRDLAQVAFWIYVHDYVDYITKGVQEDPDPPYTGRDFRDHRAITGIDYSESASPNFLIEKTGLRLGGDYAQVLVHSVSFAGSSLGGEVTMVLTGKKDPIPATATVYFTDSDIPEVESVSSAYNAVWDHSLWSETSTVATVSEPGWAGLEVVNSNAEEFYIHRKLQGTLKAYEFAVKVTFDNPRNMKILVFGLNYKPLPPAA